MSNPANIESTPETIVDYLKAAYIVDDETARNLVKKHNVIVDKALWLKSYAYYPGDLIAEIEKLEVNPSYDQSEEDEDEGE